jgi:hypothetical protein
MIFPGEGKCIHEYIINVKPLYLVPHNAIIKIILNIQ